MARNTLRFVRLATVLLIANGSALAQRGAASEWPGGLTRHLQAADAKLAEEFTVVSSVRELRDGRVLISDERDVRLVVADFRLNQVKSVSRRGEGPGEFSRVARLVALSGDTTLVAIPNARRWLILNGSTVVETRSSEDPAVAAVASGAVWGANSRGAVLAHVLPFVKGQQVPDSLAIIRVALRTGAADTVARTAMPPLSELNLRPEGAGSARRTGSNGRRFAVSLLPSDQAVMFPDGAIAIARVSPYRVEWCVGARPCTGPSIPLDPPAPMNEDEKRAYLRREGGKGGWPPTLDPEETTGWPEFLPPFMNPPMRTDATSVFAAPDGRIVIARSPTARSPRRIYDIVDRSGKRVERLAVDDDTRIVGFGKHAVYVAITDDNGIQRVQRHPW